MKKLLLLAFLLPLVSYGQVNKHFLKQFETNQVDKIGKTSYKDFAVIDNELVFMRVYESTDIADLRNSLRSFLPTVNSFKLDEQTNQNEQQFSGTINRMYVNYKKYGGSLLGTSVLLNYPFSANVIVEIKETRYRVTVKDIVFNDVTVLANTKEDYNINTVFLRKKNSELRSDDKTVKSLQYLNNQLFESFDINRKSAVSGNDNW